MKLFTVVCTIVSCALAAPASYDSSSKVSGIKTPAILKHVQQVNDDGSYTFGYENDDGSYRVENRDANGYVTGKYGYVDAFGKLHETEYVAGKLSGKSVGFQAKGDSIPVVSKAQETAFPIIRIVSPEQRTLDYEYNSVDEDEDGIPDKTPGVRATSTETKYGGDVIRASPAIKSETYATAPIVRVVETVPATRKTYSSKPAIVHVVKTVPEYPATIRLTADAAVKHSVKNYAADVKEAVVEGKKYTHKNEGVRSSETDYANKRRTSTVTIGRLDDFLRNLATSKATHQTTYYDPAAVTSGSTIEVQGDDSVAVDAFGFRRII